MDVIGELQQVGVIFNDDAFKPSLKEMAGLRVGKIKDYGVGRPQPVHGFG